MDNQITNKHFYDRISSAYDKLADANEHRAREAGEALLDLQTGESVLEVGFGTGNSLVNLATATGRIGRVCGIDVSEGMRDVATAKLAAHQLTDVVELCVGNATSLPWGDDSFDAAFLSFTLELFSEQDIDQVVQELARVLKPAGRLAVVGMATVGEGAQPSMLESVYVWMHRHFPHIVDCRPLDFEATLTRNGFVIQTSQRREIWTMPVAVVLARPPGAGG